MDEQKKEITMAVGARIKYFRLVHSLSQEELALRANVNPAYYGQVERGLKCPTVDTLYKIALALEVPPSEFLRSDALPSYSADSRRLKELLSKVPPEKMNQVFKVIEDLTELF